MTTGMMNEAIRALYPPRSGASRRRVRRSGSSSVSSSSSFLVQNGNESNLQSEQLNISTDNSNSGGGGGGGGAKGGHGNGSRSSLRPSSYRIQQNGSVSKRKKPQSRFSELLLEYGEKDLQDWAVVASSAVLDGHSHKSGGGSCQMKQMEGRLRLCSNSIVFEPRHPSRGIVRIPFRFMTSSPTLAAQDLFDTNTASTVVLCSDRHIVMKTNNVIGPYQQLHTPVQFKFVFLHSSPATMLSLATALYDAQHSPNNNPLQPNSTSRITPQQKKQFHMDQILRPMINRPFDATNFLHVHERPLTSNLRCSLLTPLLSQMGCAIVTDRNFYFQPVGSGTTNATDTTAANALGNGSNSKAHVWSMEDVRAVARRYDGMKDRGLEIYLAKQECGGLSRIMMGGARRLSSTPLSSNQDLPKSSYYSILLTFESTAVRERVLHFVSRHNANHASSTIMASSLDGSFLDGSLLDGSSLEAPPLPLPCHTDRSFVESALELWQAGQLDNFEYLLVLNSAAGRTFHDLSRYPVFPWVLSNYGDVMTDEEVCSSSSPLSTDLNLEDAHHFRDLSKPVGALNEERFEQFQKRYDSMVQQQKQHPVPNAAHPAPDAPFMYGTHYSAPGYVLYYLLRVMPEHMLCLQNGKFDVPDRLFHSIHDCFKSINTNPADVKELIPEFFDPDCFDFLINSMGLQLGNLQSGQRVNDVLLPPWAESAKDFLRKNRAALESDYCTQHLPRWIDLVFGVTSRGARAVEARNLFHPTAYLGPADMDAIQSDEEKNQLELQATEFGIVPDQLFCREHPGKMGSKHHETAGGWESWEGVVMPDKLRESYGVEDNGLANRTPTKQPRGITMAESPQGQNEAGDNSGDMLMERGLDESILTEDKESNLGSGINIFGHSLSPIRKAESLSNSSRIGNQEDILRNNPRNTSQGSDVMQVAGHHNAQKESQDFSSLKPVKGWELKPIANQMLHSDSIRGCHLMQQISSEIQSCLLTVSLDGKLMVHSFHPITTESPVVGNDAKSLPKTSAISRIGYLYRGTRNANSSNQSTLHPYRCHISSDPLACLAVTTDGSEGTVIFAGGHYDSVFAFGIQSDCALASVRSHRDAVTGVDVITNSLASDKSTHILASGSWDGTVKLWSVGIQIGEAVSIDRNPLAELRDAESSIVCVKAINVVGVGVAVAAGCTDGSFLIWMSYLGGDTKVLHKQSPRRSGSCAALKWSVDGNNNSGNMLFAAYSNGDIESHIMKNDVVYQSGRISLNAPVQCLCEFQSNLFAGTATGKIALIPVGGNGRFNARPLFWKAANGESSPGISSIHVSSLISQTAADKIVLASGGDDGSIVLFEVKRSQSSYT